MCYAKFNVPIKPGIRLRPPLSSSLIAILAASLTVAGCGGIPTQPPSAGHIRAEGLATPNPDIPPPVANTVMLARPKAAAKAESYSVSVRNIPVQDLLFALARDAKLNVDIHPGINGVVTINAIDQTLQQILSRISRQIDMRWEIDGPNLIVMPDSPFLRNYKVDYVNMSRDVSGTNSINTSIASTSSGGAGGSTSGGGNNSTTTVTSKAKNDFWVSLEKNLKDILHETDKILPEGSSETVIERSDQQATTGTGAQGGQSSSSRTTATTNSLAGSPNAASLQQQGTTVVKRTTFREAASIIVNPDAGVVVVRATARQHEKVQEYLDMTLSSARRQVIIEATIAEVNLNDTYQQGIQWSSLRSLRPGPPSAGFSMLQRTGGGILTPPVPGAGELARGTLPFLLNYVSPGLGIVATLSLLETFGNVKVLSSPKMSVLNNQTAMLKVVNNVVYFDIKTDSAVLTGNNTIPPATTATAKAVAVGLVMSVTPQVSENGSILLNVRPSISRVLRYVSDPVTPANLVPEIQTREMESMLRLTDGEIAVMGGLMSDELNNTTDTVPGISKLPGLGLLFNSNRDSTAKTELVILLKPTVIRDPSINGDYRSFRDQLPAKGFFGNNPGPERLDLFGTSGASQQ
jgi:general secretion pathway protein D